MQRLIILWFYLFTMNVSYGQYNTTIRSARPGQAFGPFTTGKNIFQIQTGISYDSFKNKDMNLSGNGLGYLLSLRYGLEEKFEIRTAIGVRKDVSSSNNNPRIL